MIDKRVFITVAVCMGIMLAWNLLVATPPPKKTAPQAASQAVKTSDPKLPATAQTPQPSSISAAPTSADLPEQTKAIVTDKVALELSSHGAALTKVVLKEYKEGSSKRSDEKYPVSLFGDWHNERVDGVALLNAGAPVQFASAESTATSVIFSGERNGIVTRAVWSLAKDDYTLSLDVEMKNTSAADVNISPSLSLGGLYSEQALKDKSMFQPPPDLVVPTSYIDGKLYKHEHGEKDSPLTNIDLAWAGIDKQYFLLAAAPIDTPVTNVAYAEKKNNSGDTLMAAIMNSTDRKLAPGESARLQYKVYAGPKKSALLKAPNKAFEEAIDYKVWFMPLGFLSRPMLWILNQAYGVFHSYGLAILMLTLVVKLLLLPVTQKSFISMQVMRELKPELDKIKERFPDDREKQGMETMRLYKERNVNPFLSGCLPALLQMPVYLALWRTLAAAVELYQQQFLWLGNLTASDPYYILPLLLGGTMFVQQKLSPPMGDPQQQKIMMYMMPPMMTVFMVGLPSGLVFYIFVNTILTILQQAYINRKFGNKTALRPAT